MHLCKFTKAQQNWTLKRDTGTVKQSCITYYLFIELFVRKKSRTSSSTLNMCCRAFRSGRGIYIRLSNRRRMACKY